MEHYDIVVIGSGPGGYPAAIRAAQLGASVALIEKNAIGGTCLNVGCIPTKTLLRGAELFSELSHSGIFGISAKPAMDYAALVGHKNKVVSTLVNGVNSLLKSNNVSVLPGTASFVSYNRIAIKRADGTVTDIGAGKVIIATGSQSVIPGFIPKHPRVIDSWRFLDMTELPKRLIVLGGGVIGCELACLSAMAGVDVVVVELLDDILTMLDDDVRREVRRAMEKTLGIRILTGKPLESIAATDTGVSGKAGSESLQADMLLVAIGRSPYTEGLNLAAAGIMPDEKGYIPVDEFCCTARAGIYAIGDTVRGLQLAHLATSEGIIAIENAVTGSRRKKETLIPAAIFTSPQVGTVGISESDAAKRGASVKVGKFFFRGLGKAISANETVGFVKWIADSETGQLLGAAAVGSHATELIHEAAVAIRAELTADEIGRTVHAHPTMSEAWMEAAHAVKGEAIHLPAKRKA